MAINSLFKAIPRAHSYLMGKGKTSSKSEGKKMAPLIPTGRISIFMDCFKERVNPRAMEGKLIVHIKINV